MAQGQLQPRSIVLVEFQGPHLEKLLLETEN